MPITVIPQNEIPLYEAEAQETHVVHKMIESKLSDLHEHDLLVRYKVCVTTVCWLLGIGGAFLIMISTASTVMFQSQPKIFALFVVGIIMEVPMLFWVYTMCCAPKPVKHERRKIVKKKKTIDVELDPHVPPEIHDLIEAEEFFKNDAELRQQVEDAHFKRPDEIASVKKLKSQGSSVGSSPGIKKQSSSVGVQKQTSSVGVQKQTSSVGVQRQTSNVGGNGNSINRQSSNVSSAGRINKQVSFHESKSIK